MPEPEPAKQTPQFDTAEYQGVKAPDWCRMCKQAVVGPYYRVNGEMACASCAEIAKTAVPVGKHSAFVRSLLFGVAGAIAGMALYAAVGIITGWMIGYVSLAVGYIIGKAMMAGSRGLGGRRYQIAALLLTYAAVSVAAVPIYLAQSMKANSSQKTAQVQQQTGEASQSSGRTSEEGAPAPTMSMGRALIQLLLVGLASPFLELQSPVHGLIGLVILFIGMQIAWKITGGGPPLVVEGPYNA
jgi:hypothetical protein